MAVDAQSKYNLLIFSTFARKVKAKRYVENLRVNFPMSRLEFFNLIGSFVKSRAPCLNTKRIQWRKREKNCNFKFKMKEMFYIHP